MSVHDIFESQRDRSPEDPLEIQFRQFLVESIGNLEIAQGAFRKLRGTKPDGEIDCLDAEVSALAAQLREMFGNECPTRDDLIEIQNRVQTVLKSMWITDDDAPVIKRTAT